MNYGRELALEKKKSNLTSAVIVLALAVNLVLACLIFAPASFQLSNLLGSPPEVIPSADPTDMASRPDMMLQWQLADQYTDGDWLVEKYREYEVYFDQNGNIVKQVPTSNFNYLKYWRNE